MLASPQILSIPLLLLANKQDKPHPECLSVEEIRYEYEAWWQNRLRLEAESGPLSPLSPRRREFRPEDGVLRSASLEVLGVSALEG